MEMKLKESSPVSRQTQNYVITSPGITLDELKQSLDRQWKKLNPQQDASTCTTSHDTASEDGFDLNAPIQGLGMAQQASGHRSMDIPQNSLSSSGWDEPMSPRESFTEGSKFFKPPVDMTRTVYPHQDLMLCQGKTPALSSSSHHMSTGMSPTSQTLTLGGKSIEGSLFLDDLTHLSWHDSGKLRSMSLSGHSRASDSSEESSVVSDHSQYCEIVVENAPTRSKLLEDRLRVHYKIPTDAARSIAAEAMRLVRPPPGVLFDKNLEHTCLEIAEARGFLENGRPVERKATGPKGIEWFPSF
eukprot:scaffold36103_cov176-Amphora_coffeaeformis.AAC.2